MTGSATGPDEPQSEAPRPEAPRAPSNDGSTPPDPSRMRHALGHFATGVTVVTGYGPDGAPVGFACQSFAAVSLAPPLVLFCADHRGRSWPLMRETGRFTVNVLGHEQHHLVRRFGATGGRRFEALTWRPSGVGGPSLPGALVRVHCAVEHVTGAGDHDVVIGRVLALDDSEPGRPMLFYRGQFTVTEAGPGSAPAGEASRDEYWG